MRIGIFGGSFDPPHLGHLKPVWEIKENLNLNQVLYVPTYHSPNKLSQGHSTSVSHRINMLEIALSDYPGFVTELFEINQKRTVFTYETIEYLQNKFPEDELFLIIGEDNYQILHTWKKINQILSQCKIVVMRRETDTHYDQYDSHESIIRFNTALIEVSSSELRDIKNIDRFSDFIPSPVIDYMVQHHLYGY